MINLLPPEEKQNLALERKKKLIIILWFLVSFFILCLILILFLVSIFARSRLNEHIVALSEAKGDFSRPDISDFQEKVDSMNLFLDQLSVFYQKRTDFNGVLKSISDILPSSIYLNNLSINFFKLDKKNGKGEVSDLEEKSGLEIALSGFAPDREILFQLKKNFENEKSFEEVYFPASNWTKSSNIDFFVKFKILSDH